MYLFRYKVNKSEGGRTSCTSGGANESGVHVWLVHLCTQGRSICVWLRRMALPVVSDEFGESGNRDVGLKSFTVDVKWAHSIHHFLYIHLGKSVIDKLC
jgi:hypothetical protein